MGGVILYKYSGAGTRDIVVKTIDAVSGGADPKSYLNPNLGGSTPVAAFFVSVRHDPANDPGESPHASMGVGSLTASAQRVAITISEDAATSTDDALIANTTNCIGTRNTTANERTGTGSLVTNGVSIDWVNNTVTRRFGYMAWAGAHVSAATGQVNLGTGTSAVSTNVGFDPDIVILFSSAQAFDNTLGGGHRILFGMAVNDGTPTQRCVAWVEANSVAAGGTPFQTLFTDVAAANLLASDGSLVAKAPLAFTATGFDLTPSASFSDRRFGYLALKLDGRNVSLASFNTPTGTGEFTITGAGFTPTAAIIVITNLEAVDSVPGATSDNQGGFSITLVADNAIGSACRIDSGSDPTDTASQAVNGIIGPSAADCDALLGTFVEFTSDGVKFNASAAQGSAKKGFALFMN